MGIVHSVPSAADLRTSHYLIHSLAPGGRDGCWFCPSPDAQSQKPSAAVNVKGFPGCTGSDLQLRVLRAAAAADGRQHVLEADGGADVLWAGHNPGTGGPASTPPRGGSLRKPLIHKTTL